MSIFVPDLIINSVLDIDESLVTYYDLKALLLDVDNTLTTHGNPEPYAGIENWITKMKRLGIKLVIISNNTHDRVEPFANRLGVDFISASLKPLTIGYTRAIKQLKMESKHIAIVGDQIYTDILGGNIKGLMTILVKPFVLENKFFFKVKRALENRYIKRYYQKREKILKRNGSDEE